MSKKSLGECRKDSDFIDYCAKQPGVHIEPGSRHMKIKTAKGTTVCSNHHKDLPNGTRHALLKQLALLGITLLFLFVLVRVIL